MPGLGHRRAKARRSSNGYGIHVLLFGSKKDVDGRNKSGHDGKAFPTLSAHPRESGGPAVTRISVLSGCSTSALDSRFRGNERSLVHAYSRNARTNRCVDIAVRSPNTEPDNSAKNGP